MTSDADPPLSGDADDAFTPIYRRYAADVYRYSLALLGNPSDAEDATQTAFLNAYRAYRRGERPREPLNWLIVIAHNACLERRRRAQRRPEEVPLDGEAGVGQVLDGDQTQEVRELLDALAKLPFGQRAALVLREVGGRSYEEIAELLGTSVKAVDMALMRARRALRRRRASLGALTAVEAPARLSGQSTTGVFAQVAGLAAPVPLAAKALAIVAAGVAAAVPVAGSALDTRPIAALPSREPAAAAGVSAAAEPAAEGRAVTVRGDRAYARAPALPAGQASARRTSGDGAKPPREAGDAAIAASGDLRSAASGGRAAAGSPAAPLSAEGGAEPAAGASAATAGGTPESASTRTEEQAPSSSASGVETTAQVVSAAVAAAPAATLPSAPTVSVPSAPTVSVPSAPTVSVPPAPTVTVPPAPRVTVPPAPAVTVPPAPSVSLPPAPPAPSVGVSVPGVSP